MTTAHHDHPAGDGGGPGRPGWTEDSPDQLYTHLEQAARELQDTLEQIKMDYRPADLTRTAALLDDVETGVTAAQGELSAAEALLRLRPGTAGGRR
jgi:hypothetical protein